ncbi:MAG TPA: tetratricopeptide repeat protein [Steroidobacteraceae bacterium]|nr:tetratricopeptide repeat protein [Steroidobacteraceae bacterium]
MTSGRVLKLSAALLSLAILLSGCGNAHSRFESHMKRGQSYFTAGDFAKASIEFRNAAQIAPAEPTARIMAGRAAQALGQPRQALALYQSVVESNPENIEARANVGRLYVLAGLPQKALETVAPGLARQPNEPSLLVVRASAKAKAKDLSGAVADVEQALRLAPDNDDALALRAALYRNAGEVDRAIKLLSAQEQAHPQSQAIREVLTDLYVTADRPGEAQAQLRALIGLDPHQLRYRRELALLLARDKQLDAAQAVLEQALRDLPTNDDAKATLVNFMASQRSPSQAESFLKGYVQQHPGDLGMQLALGDFQRSVGEFAQAASAYKTVMTRAGSAPQGLAARSRLASLYIAQGRDEDARTILKLVLEQNPHDNDALMLRGALELQQNNPGAAITDLRAVVRDRPDSIRGQQLLAAALAANGSPALAEQTLRTALDTSPTSAELRMELAKLMASSGRVAESASVLEEAVRAEPKNAAALEALVNAQLGSRQFPAALASAQALEALRKDYAGAALLAGLAAQGDNQLDLAEKEFKRACALKPDAIEPLSALARLQFQRGKKQEALALVQAAVAAAPKDALPLNLLGELYVANGEPARAFDVLQQAMQLAPNWWPPRRNLALAQLAAHNPTAAIAAYEGALKIAPGEIQLVVETAQLYGASGRIADAIAAYDAYYRAHPQSVIAANNLALLLVNSRSDQPSLDRARDLTSGFASSDIGSLLDTKGWVHFKRGEYTQALPLLERAVSRSPQEQEIRYHLAMVQLRTGQSALARTNLQQAVAGTTKAAWVRDARVTLAQLGDSSS